MPEAKHFPGSSWDAPAVAGYPISILLSEEKLLEGGGFGWAGTAWLVCPSDPAHKVQLPVSADVDPEHPSGAFAAWTPAAIIARLPANAPCNDRCNAGADTWSIRVEPAMGTTSPHLNLAEPIDPFIITEVHVVGPPGSYGFPPVGHR